MTNSSNLPTYNGTSSPSYQSKLLHFALDIALHHYLKNFNNLHECIHRIQARYYQTIQMCNTKHKSEHRVKALLT